MQKKIADASATELAEFAKLQFGLEGVRHTMGKDRILAELSKVGFAADEITVETPQTPVSSKPVKQDEIGSHEKMIIVINEQDGPGGSDPVFLAVNGRGILVPRGKESPVRKPYVEVLKNATRRIPIMGEDSSITGWREVPQYPYQILGPAPSDAPSPVTEVAAA